MRMLVTGGAGFLGFYIVEQLLAEGHEVRVLCRGTYPSLNRPGIEVMQADIRDAAQVELACAGVDAVFHVAAVPGVWGAWQMFHSINTRGTLNVLQACRKQRVSRLIYTSSPSVVFDGDDHLEADESLPYPRSWMCHYPHSKALAEQAVLEAGKSSSLRTVSLRPHLIWGPRDNHLIPRLIRKAQAGKLKRVGDGTNVVSVSYVENAATAHIQVEQVLRDSDVPAGRAYFINEPEAVNLWDWIDLLLTRAGLPVVSSSVSERTAYVAGAMLETVWKVLRLGGEPPMTRFVAAQLAGSHSYSIAAAARDFGYSPAVSIEEGLRRLQPDLDALTRGSE
ncbi:MAG: NAD-dependent epimerase/dehydratase family protein [Planctomycetaceae bacterium]|nr:NAD-dependent epimerase/dehydratase family protein [Planctomycetaceae bacterium]